MLLTVEYVTDIRAQLWEAGFRPVPVFNHDAQVDAPGKQPLGKAWQADARKDPPFCAINPAVAHALNTGILCDGLRPIDIDIDDHDLAIRCRALVTARLGEAPVRYRANSSRCTILYRAADGEPTKLSLSGDSHTTENSCKIEVLGRGQQFVALGIHHTGTDLEWFPDTPGHEERAGLPAVTEDQIHSLVAELAVVIGASKLPGRTNGQDHTPGEPQADLLRIATALADIPNTGPPDWEAWNRAGMAIWRATGGSPAGWEAWEAWSKRNPAYDPTKTRERWDHWFISPPTQIGAGTIFHMAKEARPAISLFQPSAAARPEGFEAPADGPRLLPLVYFDAIKPNLDAADFVEGLLIEASMAVVYGESNCGKTFFMTDLGLHIAMGKPWRGREIEHGGVIYCALEGSHGISNRVAAFRLHHKLDGQDIPFAIVPSGVNMLDPAADTQPLIDTIRVAMDHMRVPVRLVVIDTLSRALAGGNENAPDDMGALVTNTDRVRQATTAAVAYVHHSGKDQAKGARGHSLLRAATDTEIEVSRDDTAGPSLARVTKQREMEIEGEFPFKLEVIELGQNRRGKSVTSCVVVDAELAKEDRDSGTKRDRLPPNAALGMRALSAVMSSSAAKLPPLSEYPPNTVAVAASMWRDEFYQLKSGSTDTKKHAFSTAETVLLARNIITQRNGLVWFVKNSDTPEETG